MESIIKISNLVKKFNFSIAIDITSLEINKSGIIGLLGPNGAGKTTLMKIISGMITSYNGEVLIEGNKVGVKTKELVSYIPEIEVIPSWWTIEYAIKYFNDFFNYFNKDKALSIINSFNINIKSKFRTLSKGTKEKVQFVLSLSREVKVYIFDEPALGVDPIARDFILNLILEHCNKDSIVLISTHLISNIENMLDYVIFIKNGKILDFDNKQNILNKYATNNLESVFKGII